MDSYPICQTFGHTTNAVSVCNCLNIFWNWIIYAPVDASNFFFTGAEIFLLQIIQLLIKGESSCANRSGPMLYSVCCHQAQTLGSWVWILLKAWMYVHLFSAFVLPCVSRGLVMAEPPSREFYQLSIWVIVLKWEHSTGSKP
jgi:hypothetical protein